MGKVIFPLYGKSPNIFLSRKAFETYNLQKSDKYKVPKGPTPFMKEIIIEKRIGLKLG